MSYYINNNNYVGALLVIPDSSLVGHNLAPVLTA